MGEKIINDGIEAATKKISGSFSDYLSLMLGKPRIRINNLKTSLRLPCLGLNPIIDSINLNSAERYPATSPDPTTLAKMNSFELKLQARNCTKFSSYLCNVVSANWPTGA